jgi:uncharacterized protein
MAVQVSYPGVYIDEFAPPPPIEGVGTSTAAFLGPMENGPLNEPTKVTNLDTFLDTFGRKPLPGVYGWYAVRGFFRNGGQVCYVVRVSNAAPDELVLKDRSAGGGKPVIRLVAREAKAGSGLQVTVAAASAVTTKAFRPAADVASAAGRTIKVTAAADAVRFRPGDVVTLTGTTERATVTRIEDDLLRLAGDLAGSYESAANKKVHLVPLEPEATSVRVEDGAKLAGGSVVKVAQATDPVTEEFAVVERVDVEPISAALTTYRVVFRRGLTKSYALAPDAAEVALTSQEFTLTVTQNGDTRTYAQLAMDPGHPRYFAGVVDGDPAGPIHARPVEPPATSPPPNDLPADLANATSLAGGKNDDPNTLGSGDYKRGLAALELVDDVNMLAIPDRSDDLDVQLALIDHCQAMQERFAILDGRRGAPLFGGGSISTQRQSLQSVRGYGALYYPWLVVPGAANGDRVLVPPSGHVAGVYARTDASRGVHKAPAGIEAEVRDCLGVERSMTDVDQGQLNLAGINVVRVFHGGRPVVWGARTIAADKNWQYASVRRLFLFLEESIQLGIRWAVFEPNTPELWEKLKRTIRAFLLQQWRAGALFGAVDKDAFYVRIDEALNPEADRKLGRLTIEIGVRPAYPAEFVVVRIGIWEGGAEVTEG